MSQPRAMAYIFAKACEEAREDKCVCRCKGALHGARRTAYPELLPEDDLHYPAAEVRDREKDTRKLVRTMVWWYAHLPYSSRAWLDAQREARVREFAERVA